MKKTLFLSALLSMLPHLHAAVGDTLDLTQGFVAEGVDATFASGGMTFDNTALKTSTRFYDSTKGWSEIINNSAGDSYMCWAHTAGNLLQYWQSYYGVFYKGNYGELPYGTDYKRTINPNIGASYIITDPMRLNTTKHLITVGFNLKDTGGYVYEGIDYYFCRHQSGGGYYSEYFGAFNTGDSIPSGQTSTVTVVNSQENLTPALLSALGITKQGDGTYKQTEAGLIAHLNVGADVGSTFSAHTLTCYGLTLDETGNIKSIIYADSDNYKLNGIAISEGIGSQYTGGLPSMEQAYVKIVNGKVMLYTDAACTTPLTYGTSNHYYLGAVTQINTPEVLQNMLAEYSDVANEAQVWNGKGTAWEQQTATTDELPTESTGWDVHVNGANIATEHHGHYHTYSTNGRAVRFDEHADNRTVTINGTVAASSIEVAAAGYTFKAGENASIQAGADLTLRSMASLNSELALQLNNLTLESGTVLAAASPITVKGNFLVTLKQEASVSLLAAATPGVAINADLNLSEANSVSLETTVDLMNHTLTLREGQSIVVNGMDGTSPLFANIGTLYINGQAISEGSDLSEHLVFLSQDGSELTDIDAVYRDGAIWVSIPEPTTATLSLLALAALSTRRRRH